MTADERVAILTVFVEKLAGQLETCVTQMARLADTVKELKERVAQVEGNQGFYR